MTKIGFGRVTVLALVAGGAVVLSASEGCSVSLTPYTCVRTVNSGSCPNPSDVYYTGCGSDQTPIDSDININSCAATGTAGNYCCPLVAEAGSDSSPPVDSSATDSSVPLNACNECLYQGCSGYWSLCQQDNSCITVYHCATACAAGDQTCVNNCYAAGTTSGQKAYLNLATCDNAGLCGACVATCSTPMSSCAVPDGGSAPDSSVIDNCATCTTSLCGPEKTACGAGSACDDYTQCLTSCADSACIDACGLADAAGKMASTALGDCTSMNCKAACGL